MSGYILINSILCFSISFPFYFFFDVIDAYGDDLAS